MKSITRGFLVGALVSASFLFGTGATAAVIPTGPVSVRNWNSGLCLEVSNGSLAPGARVLQWTCHGGNHQQWRVNDLHNGYVQLVAEHSAQCLEVDNASLADGAGVLQWPCHGGTHQQWKMTEPFGVNNGIRFMARHSSKCLEVNGGSFAPGAGVLQWPCHSGSHQRWFIV
jgi:hypothetical protein